eukprot:13038437-Ditylum_brightwellii.AAC.1
MERPLLDPKLPTIPSFTSMEANNYGSISTVEHSKTLNNKQNSSFETQESRFERQGDIGNVRGFEQNNDTSFLEMLQRRKGTEDSIEQFSMETDSAGQSINMGHIRNISFGTQEKNVRSSLLETLRRRKDSDDSIEVFGTDESVKFDSRSNKLTVKNRRTSNRKMPPRSEKSVKRDGGL